MTKQTKKSTATAAPSAESEVVAAAAEPNADMAKQLADALAMVQQLTAMVQSEAASKAQMQARLSVQGGGNAFGELMVGIRNISDQTVGIPPIIRGDTAMQLNANFGDGEPGTASLMSYAAWLEFRKHKYVREGLVIRDDSVVGRSFSTAPEDEPKDMPAEARYNALSDPKAWIESRTEDEIRRDLPLITSEFALFRLRRIVSEKLAELENRYPRATKAEQVYAAQRSLMELPGNYRVVDDLTTMRIEGRSDLTTDMLSGNASGNRLQIKL